MAPRRALIQAASEAVASTGRERVKWKEAVLLCRAKMD